MKATVLIGVIGVAFGGAIGYYKVYEPNLEQARLIQQKAAQLHDDWHAQDEVASLLKQVEQFRKRLPPEPEPSWLSREVVELTRHAGLELSSITANAGQEFRGITHLSVSIQFEATYHEIGMLLDDVERSDYFLRVEHLDMSNQHANDERPAVTLTLGTIYMPPVTNALSLSAK